MTANTVRNNGAKIFLVNTAMDRLMVRDFPPHNLDPSLDETHLVQFGIDRCSGLDRKMALGLRETEKVLVNLVLTAI